ncbi:MAG: DUF418 domain-containing protein [Anaerolineae bacterium]
MKRIVAIDNLRGFALLGILIMNIMSFGMPSIAYFNPAAFGGDDWVNRMTYAFVHIFADQKFMALFSMLFGASLMLLIKNLERKGTKVARFHYTRNFWLLIIGFLHGILIWDGDILTIYALCAFLLYFLRNVAPKWQFALGLIIFLLPAIGYIVGGTVVSEMPMAQVASLQAYWQPSMGEISAEIALYQGDYLPQLLARLISNTPSGSALDIYFVVFIFEFFTRAFGMMLIGMALYSWGVVTAQQSDYFYKRLLIIGLLVGVPLAGVGVWWNSSADWSAVQVMFMGRLPNLLATPLVAGAYIGLIMLWSRSSLWRNLQNRLAATGRMALTNYIMHSLIGTFIFYGFGLGLFGSLNRVMLLPIIVAIWLFQLWLSPFWLHYFRFGPLEWMWRSLSYWELQPLRHSVKTA